MGPALDSRKLQFIDRWVGMVVCWILSRVRVLVASRAETRNYFAPAAIQMSSVIIPVPPS
jgi:hypothetical protein